jgi:hypothetical protein
MGNAADQTGRPQRLALRAASDRSGRVTELGKSLAGAATGGYKLAAAAFYRVRDQVLLTQEHGFAGHILESLDGYHAGGQQLLDHPGNTFFRQHRRLGALAPLAWVAEQHLLESDTVVAGCAPPAGHDSSAAEHLHAYLKRLPDFNDVEDEERALDHAEHYGGLLQALSFQVS